MYSYVQCLDVIMQYLQLSTSHKLSHSSYSKFKLEVAVECDLQQIVDYALMICLILNAVLRVAIYNKYFRAGLLLNVS